MRQALGKFVGLLPKRQVRPAGLEEEDREPCLPPGLDLVRVAADAHVGCNDYQFRLPRQRSHPDNVFDIARKTVLEVNDMMFRLHHLIQPAGQFRREVVVEKEFHASSERSKSTASRTETGLTSNHRATSEIDGLARTLLARTR